MKILFLVPYPLQEAPSQRFRFEQYFQLLNRNGIEFSVQSFLTEKNWRVFYSKGNVLKKLASILSGFTKRIFVLFTVPRYDYIFIHREAAPVGPPIFEWTIAKIFGKKIVYDFDDAIWMTDNHQESSFERLLRWRSKVASICRWSYKVSCGNDYLCNYARQFNRNVILNPTTIDTETLHNRELYGKNMSSTITIGWTGSHSTLKYLKDIEGTLQQLEQQFSNVNILIIANQIPALALNRLQFIPWRKETEAIDLLMMDIGIMPLPDDEWTSGKCGFKALQYMSMEIPCVVSPVGVNSTIVEDRVSGFLAKTKTEWLDALTNLIKDKELREQLGKAGRKRVVDQYSVISNQRNFLLLFE